MMMNISGNQGMSMMNGSGNNMMTMNRSGNSNRMMNSSMMLNSNQGHTTSHHQQPAMSHASDKFDFVKEEMKREMSADDDDASLSEPTQEEAVPIHGVMCHYLPLIRAESKSHKKALLYLKAMDEMLMILNGRRPTKEETAMAFELLKSSFTSRDDYHAKKGGCKIPVDDLLHSLEQVDPFTTTHFILILMLCPKGIFNCEGAVSVPKGKCKNDCCTLRVLQHMSDAMLQSSVDHLSGLNFVSMNAGRSICETTTTKWTSPEGKTRSYTHCNPPNDEEAEQRSDIANSAGHFLKVCGVPSLLGSFAGDGISKLKSLINRDMFSVFAGVYSPHGYTIEAFAPVYKTVGGQMAGVFGRLMVFCNAYELLVYKHVLPRVAELKIQFDMPTQSFEEAITANPALPYAGNPLNPAAVAVAEENKSVPWGRNEEGDSIYHKQLGEAFRDNMEEEYGRNESDKLNYYVDIGTLGGEALRDKKNEIHGYNEKGNSNYFVGIGAVGSLHANLLRQMAAELHDLRGDFTNLVSLDGVFEDDKKFKVLFDRYPDELLDKLKEIHNKKMNDTVTFEFNLKDVLNRKKEMGFEVTGHLNRGKKSIRIDPDEDILPDSLGSEAVSIDASNCGGGKLRLTKGMEVKCYNGENVEGSDQVFKVLPPLWNEAKANRRLTLEVFSYTCYRDVGPK